MKRITAIAFSILAVLTTASGAMAQVGLVRATVPFDFSVGNKRLPSGTYEVTYSLGNVIKIQNTADPHVMTLVSTMRDSTISYKESVLIFEKYGNRYFLHEVFGPSVMDVSLYTSKEEKQIRQQTAMLNNANTILLAAN